ncbi:hypothetical protein GCM10027589_52200 [Actinocorallia lasiicapitis]
MTIEYELEQAGVMLLAGDEPLPDLRPKSGGRATKRATPLLTRRVKQAVSEWYVMQMLEQSWDGTCEHTEQGWNIGKPCYGYRANKFPHPVAAKRSEGRTKTRLVPHEVEGPVVTKIFTLRKVGKHGYDTIANILNEDLGANPPPTPGDPRRRLGRWSGAAIREILANPKYTGYMVWNRRATKKGGKKNPPEGWVWSSRPTHEPLVTKELFASVTPIGKYTRGVRSGSAANPHPQTVRTYALRSYVVCDLCDRRMYGKHRRNSAYFVCEVDMRHHSQRRAWYEEHSKSLWIREDDLLTLVHEFFTDRVLGESHGEWLGAAVVADTGEKPALTRLKAELTGLNKRVNNLMVQQEEYEPTGDEDIDQEARAGLRARYVELLKQRKAKTAELTELETATRPKQDDPTLLAELPVTVDGLAGIPEEAQRALYSSFNLELRYLPRTHEVIIRVTIKEDAMPAIRSLINQKEDPSEDRSSGDKGFPCSAYPQRDSNPCYRLERAAS